MRIYQHHYYCNDTHELKPPSSAENQNTIKLLSIKPIPTTKFACLCE